MRLPNSPRLFWGFISVFIGVLVLLLWRPVMPVNGQRTDNSWTEPVNLSLSGSASEPQIFTDDEGILHIIWQDSIDDFVYVYGDGAAWEELQPVELPFGTRRFYPDLDEDDPTPLFKPQLGVDEDGRLHAVWIDDVNDLYHSSVDFEDFADFAGWAGRKKIASSVLAVSLDVGPDGLLHVAYLQTAEDDELQPGIFYTQSNNGETWREAVSLFTSRYYRLLEAELANVQLAVADENNLFVAWDDWPNERVLTIRSVDGGETWDEPDEVDKRQEEDDVTAVGPSSIQIVANDKIVHVIWQAGHDGLACSPYYQWSSDDGESWETAKRIWDAPANCPPEIGFEEYGDSFIIRASTAVNSFIVPWIGSAWGAPQPQTALNSVTDPETFKPITYTCGQDSVSLEAKLWLVACGQGEASQDVWVLSRSLVGVDIVPDVALWSFPFALAGATTSMISPVVVTDEVNRFHVFWGRAGVGSNPSLDRQVIDLQYTRWADGQWSTPKTVLDPASGGDSNFSVTVDGAQRILLVWSGAERGEIYFSQVSTGLAVLSAYWSEPHLLSGADSVSSSPQIAVDNNGVIYVAYTVPINEERGIYLVKSTDSGNSWTEPSLVLDLNGADWGLIDKPRLALTGDGSLHLLWLNQPFTGNSGASLYYAYSHDGGESWSEATAVVSDNQQEAAVLWSQIAADEKGTLHRVWQEWIAGQINLWHQISVDNGRSWSQPIRITALNVSTLPATLTIDQAGQLHLIYFDPGAPEVPDEPLALRHWVWRGDQWHREAALTLDDQPMLDVDFVAAVIGSGSRLAALYSGPRETKEEALFSLYFSERNFPMPDTDVTPQPLPTVVSTVTAEPSPTVIPELEATPIPTLAPSAAIVSPVTKQSPLVGILIGLAAAAMPVGLVFTLFLIRQNRIKSR